MVGRMFVRTEWQVRKTQLLNQIEIVQTTAGGIYEMLAFRGAATVVRAQAPIVVFEPEHIGRMKSRFEEMIRQVESQLEMSSTEGLATGKMSISS